MIIDAREAKDQNSPTVDAVKIFYRRVENVTTVKIFGSSRLALLIYDPDVATSSFSKMSYLFLGSTFKCLGDPFCPALYVHLHHYFALDRLKVLVMRSSESIQPTALLPKPPYFLGAIVDFSLNGPISTSHNSVQCLLSAFGPLYALSLVDSAPTSRLPEILSGLDAPEHLRVLALNHQSEDDNTPSIDLSDNFKAFSTLGILVLGGSSASTASSLYTSLEPLPIDSLAFTAGAEVSLLKLKRVISGRAKHKNLSTIHFDHFEGKIGTRMDDETGPHWDEDDEEWTVYPDWLLPEWTEEFDEAGLIEFVELAAKEGIQVIGSAVEAIGVDEEYRKELAKLEAYRKGSDENEKGGT